MNRPRGPETAALATDTQLAQAVARLQNRGIGSYGNHESQTLATGFNVAALVEYGSQGQIVSWAAYRGEHHDGSSAEAQHWQTAYRGEKLPKPLGVALFRELPARRYRR